MQFPGKKKNPQLCFNSMCADLFKQTCEFVVSRGEFVVSRSQLYRLTPKFFRATSVISYAVKSTENTSDAE